MGTAIPIAVVVGTAVGALLGYMCARLIVRWLSASVGRSRLVTVFAGIALLAMLPVGIFLSVFVGGSLVAPWSEFLFAQFGNGLVGVPIGFAIGIAAILAALLAGAAAVGVLFGLAALRVMRWKTAA